MLKTIVTTAATLALAWLAFQLARVDAGLGTPFGPDRLMRLADADPAVTAKDIARAREALQDRPIEGRAYRLLAQAAAAAGDTARANQLLDIAVARSPRDPIARALQAEQAFRAGETNTALEHLDAILRVAPHARRDVLALMLPHLADEAFRLALAERLALDPPWRGAVPAALRGDATDPALAEALLAALAQRTALTEAEQHARIQLLDRLGQSVRARALWLDTLPADARGAARLVFDGGFEHPGIEGGHGWQFDAPPGSGIEFSSLDPREGTSALAIRFDGRAVQFAGVRQPLALVPGRYRLRGASRMRIDNPRPFAWRIDCRSGMQLVELQLPAGSDWQSAVADFSVPAGCTGQQLRLLHLGRSLAERRLTGMLEVDAVAVQRIAGS